MLFQNFLNTWWDHEIADSAQPRYRSIVTRPFSLLVRAGSGHETSNSLDISVVSSNLTFVQKSNMSRGSASFAKTCHQGGVRGFNGIAQSGFKPA